MTQAILNATPAAAPARPIAERRPRKSSDFGFVQMAGMVVIAVLFVEALIAFRAWVQLSGTDTTGVAGLLYGLSSMLVAPFRGLETTTPVNADMILELSTLVAFEAYLVFGLIAVGALWLLRSVARATFGAHAARRATSQTARVRP